nr:PREDICTED: uncharacterized protein LOC109043596 isoform X1 [Bemisia tabaci]XP_018916401.1 PREDICTED: uncharacterized protein LOC109043596 isoform X2 [Bemisia tabaci]
MKAIVVFYIFLCYQDHLEAKPGIPTQKPILKGSSIVSTHYDHKPSNALKSGQVGSAVVDKAKTAPSTPPPPPIKPPIPADNTLCFSPHTKSDNNHQGGKNPQNLRESNFNTANSSQKIQQNNSQKADQKPLANVEASKNAPSKVAHTTSQKHTEPANAKGSPSKQPQKGSQNQADVANSPPKQSQAGKVSKDVATSKMAGPKDPHLSKSFQAPKTSGKNLKRSVPPKAPVQKTTQSAVRDKPMQAVLQSPPEAKQTSPHKNKLSVGIENVSQKSEQAGKPLSSTNFKSVSTVKPTNHVLGDQSDKNNLNSKPKQAQSSNKSENLTSPKTASPMQTASSHGLTNGSTSKTLNSKITPPPEGKKVNGSGSQTLAAKPNAATSQNPVSSSAIRPNVAAQNPHAQSIKNAAVKNGQTKAAIIQNPQNSRTVAAKPPQPKTSPVKRSSDDKYFSGPRKNDLNGKTNSKNIVPRSPIPGGSPTHTATQMAGSKSTQSKPVKRVKKSNEKRPYKRYHHDKRAVGRQVAAQPKLSQFRVITPAETPGKRFKKSIEASPGELLYAWNHPFNELVYDPVVKRTRRSVGSDLQHRVWENDFRGVKVAIGKRSVNEALNLLENPGVDVASLSNFHRSHESATAFQQRKQRAVPGSSLEARKKLQRLKTNAIPEDLFYSLKKPLVDSPSANFALHPDRKPRGMAGAEVEERLESPATFFKNLHRSSTPIRPSPEELNENFWVRQI